jgi:predicted dehydrogenase
MHSIMNRRRFLQQSAAATASASVLGFPAILRSASPNSMLQVACIGVARMGGNTMRSVATHPKVKIVSICDVDANHLKEAATGKGSARAGGVGFPDASQHTDWRQMLRDHSDKFDAVTVGTPDHMHAPMAVQAMRLKKHVYLQKPMAPTIHECRVIQQEAVRAGVVTQLGNQGRSGIEARMTVDLLRNGAIGKIKEAWFWEGKPLSWWPKNEELRAKGDNIPAELDWDSWVGVRELRPYLVDTYHPQTWRAWRDFGVGELGDMGVHFFDGVFDALKLRAPKRVKQTATGALGAGLWAKSRTVEFEFPGNELIAGDTFKLTWCDGEDARPAREVPMPAALKNFPKSGHLWVGEKGQIFKPYGQRPWVLPEDSFPAEKYPRDYGKQDHYHDWVDAILNGKKSCADFSHGGPLTETVLMGTLAENYPNQWVEWDREAMRVTNIPEANRLLKREYRDGWKVEGLG